MLTNRVRNEQDLRDLVFRVRTSKNFEEVKQDIVLLAGLCGDLLEALVRSQKDISDLKETVRLNAKEVRKIEYDLDRVKTKQGR